MVQLRHLYPVLMLLAVALYTSLNEEYEAQSIVYEVITLVALVIACIGVRHHRPPRQRL